MTAQARQHLPATEHKPTLVVDAANHSATAQALTRLFARSGSMFELDGVPVKVIEQNGEYRAVPLNPYHVINEAHELCRPIELDSKTGLPNDVPLPKIVAQLFLNAVNARGLRPLRGFCQAPLLGEDGSVRCPDGYDPPSQFWYTGAGADGLMDNPLRADAERALGVLREGFRTIPFADDNAVRDLTTAPSLDESSMLAGLLTAVCRPSLPFAPGLLVRAPLLSGAGTGKGQLVRAIAEIAYGRQPAAFTAGSSKSELRKRIESASLAAAPVMFLDNCNATVLASDELAQFITEVAVMTRPLGRSRMAPIETRAFVAVTGNGIKISEDLARRFLVTELDAKCENPEQRRFQTSILESISAQRSRLRSAALTIWRWGRQNPQPPGIPAGSFEVWSRWCRDPLLALGCVDPMARSTLVKADDPYREQASEFLATWFRHHGSTEIRLEQLHKDVRLLAGGRSRQALASFAKRLDGTRVGGLRALRHFLAWMHWHWLHCELDCRFGLRPEQARDRRALLGQFHNTKHESHLR